MFRTSYIRWNLWKVPFNYSRSKFHPRLDFRNCWFLTERDQWKSQVLREAKNLGLDIGNSGWAKAKASHLKHCFWNSACTCRNLSFSMIYSWSAHWTAKLTHEISITVTAKVKSQKWLFNQYCSSCNLSALDCSLQLCLMQSRHRGKQRILTEINNVV